MMASTHALIGAVSFAGLSALCGNPAPLPLGAATLGAAALGALLPDVDTPSSRAGFCVYPLARYLERKFGHRTLTHSVFGTLAFALLCAPLLLVPALHTLWPALLIGYFSHLLADAATKSGVPMLWPSRDRWVFPGHEKYRVKTGSKAEIGVFLGFALLAALLVPLAQNGPRRLLHILTASLPGAVRDVEDMGRDRQLWAHVQGYDVLHQKLIDGTFSVLGRRDDGGLVVEPADTKAGVSGYWLLKESGSEIHRIAPRRVKIEPGAPRYDQTRTMRVANITLTYLARELAKACPSRTLEDPSSDLESDRMGRLNYERGREHLNTRYLHQVLLSGAGECYPFPQQAEFAPVDAPQFGLKSVAFNGAKVEFNFAQPNHLTRASSRVALKSATLTVTLPQGAKWPNFNRPTVRRELFIAHLRRQSDLLVRVGDLVSKQQTLDRTFAQRFETPPTPQEQEKEHLAEGARRELRALEIEELALRRRAASTWAMLSQSYRARRAALEAQANYAPPVPKDEPLPPAARAPFDAVVETVEWEPPTIPTRPGEKSEHAARVTLVQIAR